MHPLVQSEASLESMEDTFSSPAKKLEREALDPSRTLSPSSVVTATVEDNNANPFFVVDWFKQLRVGDNETRSSYKTPEKQTSTSSLTTSPTHPSPSPTKFPFNSPFQKQSEAVGAGWNAKGLQKARKDDWQGALECWEMALDIRTQVLGDNHKDVSNTHNNLGIALGRLGRQEEAMFHLQKALEIRTALYGSTHQDVAATHHNIGNVRQKSGDSVGALESFCEAKRIQTELLGASSAQVARAWNAIGHLHFETQQYTKARDAYSHALDTFRKAGRTDQDMEVEHTKQDLQEAEELLPPC
jgi:tetratricopeptide (TPR) repeat protein